MSRFDATALRPVTLADRLAFTTRVARHAPFSCEYNFLNFLCWSELYDNRLAETPDRLYLHDNVSGNLLMPLGEGVTVEELWHCSRELAAHGYGAKIALVPDEFMAANPQVRELFDVEREEDYGDYIYSTRKMLELKGEKLHKKKNLVSQFQRFYPNHQIVPVRPLLDECFALSSRLNRALDSETAEEELVAIREVFSNFDAVGAEGLALMVEGVLVAFAVFSRQTPVLYTTHFEKADHEFKGSTQAMTQATAAFLLDKCELVNREQDLGIPGLRKAKRSYCPEFLHMTSSLTPKPAGSL